MTSQKLQAILNSTDSSRPVAYINLIIFLIKFPFPTTSLNPWLLLPDTDHLLPGLLTSQLTFQIQFLAIISLNPPEPSLQELNCSCCAPAQKSFEDGLQVKV